MTSTKKGSEVGGYRSEVDQQKLGPTLVIALKHDLSHSYGALAPIHSDGLANMEWEKEIEHSVRIARLVLSHLTTRYPDMFQAKQVPWYVATDEEVPK
jgi:hypothetical protein